MTIKPHAAVPLLPVNKTLMIVKSKLSKSLLKVRNIVELFLTDI